MKNNIVYFFALIVITRIIPVICSKSLYWNDFSYFLPPNTIPVATSFTILERKNCIFRNPLILKSTKSVEPGFLYWLTLICPHSLQTRGRRSNPSLGFPPPPPSPPPPPRNRLDPRPGILHCVHPVHPLLADSVTVSLSCVEEYDFKKWDNRQGRH